MKLRLGFLILALSLAASCEDEEPEPARFRVTVQPEVIGFQGADALVRVTLERDPGFSDDVEVVFAGDGDALDSPGVRFSKSMTDGYVIVAVGLEAEIERKSLSVIARSGKTVQNRAFTLDLRAAEPFAQELIESARADGEIDDGTALLYRAYALFGDPSLPEEYRGAGSFEEDNFLFPQIEETAPTLTVEMQEQLLQFVRRPSNGNSYWGRVAASATATRAGETLPPESCAELTERGFQWVSQRSGSYPVRVWASCLGEEPYDAQSMEMLADTLSIMNKIWQPEGELMGDSQGNPLLDDGGGDEAIDVYLDRGFGTYRGNDVYDTPAFAAQSVQTTPTLGKGRSGFIIVPEVAYGSPRFHATLIHELFHVHQFRHNAALQVPAGVSSAIGSAGTAHWFYEASATWAVTHYDREIQSLPRPRAAYDASFIRFKARFQRGGASLNDSSDLPSRSAFIWPYFLEQAGGGKAVIGQIWKNLAPANTYIEADDIIDAAYPFDEHFRELAFRNINEELMPGDPLPKDERHINGDPEFRDDGAAPDYHEEFTLEGVSSQGFELSIKPLSARYAKFKVGASVKQLVFTLPSPTDFPDLDVDVLIKKNGTWESEPRDLNGKEELKLCEPVEELRFIFSNPQRLEDQLVGTALTVTSSPSECQATWHGTASHQIDDGPGTSMRLEASVTWVLDTNQSGPGMEVYYPTGTVTVTQTEADCTVTWAPSSGDIEQDMMSSLAIYPDGSGGFMAFGNGLTLWDSVVTKECPLQTPSTTTQASQIGGNWFTAQTTLGPDGDTLIGTSGVTGDKYEWSFTKD